MQGEKNNRKKDSLNVVVWAVGIFVVPATLLFLAGASLQCGLADAFDARPFGCSICLCVDGVTCPLHSRFPHLGFSAVAARSEETNFSTPATRKDQMAKSSGRWEKMMSRCRIGSRETFSLAALRETIGKLCKRIGSDADQ